ncbi:MAG: DUF4157 domain-containing protein [Alphaproteobacteria bacterium]|nr:DUF4157 domain-containing protein [Alphaproteobacteria bacterium]
MAQEILSQMAAASGRARSTLPHGSLMARAFGEDAVRDVDVVQSPEAAAALAATGARAAHLDGTLVFRPNASPREVAHEMVHLEQARSAGSRPGSSSPTDAHERDAETLADKAAQGQEVAVPARPTTELDRWSWGGVRDTLASVVDTVTGAVPDVVAGAGDVLSGAVETAGTVTETVVDGAAAVANSVADAAGNVARVASSTAGDVVSGISDRAGDGLSLGMDVVGDGLSATASAVDDALGTHVGPLGGVADHLLDRWGAVTDAQLDTVGDALETAMDRGGANIDQLLEGLGAATQHGLDGWGNWVRDGAGQAADRLHGGFETAAVYLEARAQSVRGLWDLDQEASLLYGEIDIPKSSGDFQQQYSETGLPMTASAWEMQDAIDGGALREVYERSVVQHLLGAGLLENLADTEELDNLPESTSQLSSEQVYLLLAQAKERYGEGESFLNSLDPTLRRDLQDDIVTRYVALANSTEGASFILELLPTDVPDNKLTSAGIFGEAAIDALLLGQLPDDFRVGEMVGKTRLGSVTLAEQLGGPVFALPVPYSNVATNVIARGGVPTDGAANLQALLGLIDDDVQTLGTGYSQGSAAVYEALSQQDSNAKTLDMALLMAQMGGLDAQGQTGVAGGEINGTQTLSIAHEKDPASLLYIPEADRALNRTRAYVQFVKAGINFLDDSENQIGDGALHGKTCEYVEGDEFALCNVALYEDIAELGTLGYPAELVAVVAEDLLSGEYGGASFQVLGEWGFDNRTLNYCADLSQEYELPDAQE